MKIACLGNMNNVLFQIGRYLIDDKHEVTFFLFDEFEHFLPEADTYEDILKYNIVKLGWNKDNFFDISRRKVNELFSDFDVLIGTDLAPAFLFKAGLKLNYFFPHGSDLYEFPFFKYKNHPPQPWEIPFNIVSLFQRKGIKYTDTIMMDESEEVYELPLRRIRKSSTERICAPPFLYLTQYVDEYEKRSVHYNEFRELRDKYNLVVFQQISQDWSMRGPFKIDKGNDKLIIGFANYLKKNESSKNHSILVLMEYGGDVEKSRKLVEELEIVENVKWFKKMNRKDLMALISLSDICVGELGYRAWYTYSSIMEFMAMKKPLIHHRGDEIYKAKGLELYPMIDVKDAKGVEEVLVDFMNNKQKYVEMGLSANEWIIKDTKRRIETFKQSLLSVSHANHLPFFWLRKFALFLNIQLVYNYLFFYLYKVKSIIR